MTDLNFWTRLADAKPRLLDLMDGFSRARVLAIGDLTLDEFLFGQVERLSREAPVLILRHEVTRQIPGGGANAIYNLAKLNAHVTAAGYIGADSQGDALRDLLGTANIDTRSILSDRDRPTVTKTRISGHARQSVTQQIVRIDRKSDDPPAPDLQRELAARVGEQLADTDAVVCSDYGDGALSPPTIAAALQGNLVAVDAQTGLHRYAGATIFTPNLPEAEQSVGYGIVDADSLVRAGCDLLALTRAEAILITRGEDGMSLFQRDRPVEHIPAFNRTDVFDVTGAGDTVIAALTLAICAGGNFWEAAILGNLAASLVVRQFGTATTSTTAMQEALQVLIEEADGLL
ncbi:ADP-heptose synthase, bifunctional sugar kinase/adenylyltransferase [Rubidibacter lacunae KORDI 51-2]|uniref:ADP-heptose synthase, bifunctional sugar kinase/adenylyltransferase n=1 Tax=Rubidibacter lacunae KORDI 51-2 TaxID=582515 RepID=U5DKN8_9CHRO|nr:PfkB family carbohydrate kinase [Rubidibacter lacunae]ERN41114.1 ADP-heptose synthase, bifunctional sugar kinase/adenylyltransferase [Rubidibacter lacunae KORDI 51-2]